jgi:hypothetical protein
VALACFVALALPATAQRVLPPPRVRFLTLRGTVAREDGAPLPGATAYVYTAAARRGTSPY